MKVFIMKKILYIFAIIFGLSAVSCQKQDVAPIATDTVEVPTWESLEKSGDIEGDDEDSDVDIDITDPNNDPDGDKGKGKN